MANETLDLEAPIAPVDDLATNFTAVAISFTWFGVRRSLTTEQNEEAAEAFGADGEVLSSFKKLLDTRDPAYKATTGVRSRIRSLWKGMTLPYVEGGIRLLPNQRVDDFNAQMAMLKAELKEKVAELRIRFDDLKLAQKSKLGKLYNEDDYKINWETCFNVEWNYTGINPPDWMKTLRPDLYEKEVARIKDKFEESLLKMEEMYSLEFLKLIRHLSERLNGMRIDVLADGKKFTISTTDLVTIKGDGNKEREIEAIALAEGDDVLFDGKWYNVDSVSEPKEKIFRDSAIDNIKELADKFRGLSVRSNSQLDKVVEDLDKLAHRVPTQSLRDSSVAKKMVSEQLKKIEGQFEGLMFDVNRKRRNISRDG